VARKRKGLRVRQPQRSGPGAKAPGNRATLTGGADGRWQL